MPETNSGAPKEEPVCVYWRLIAKDTSILPKDKPGPSVTGGGGGDKPFASTSPTMMHQATIDEQCDSRTTGPDQSTTAVGQSLTGIGGRPTAVGIELAAVSGSESAEAGLPKHRPQAGGDYLPAVGPRPPGQCFTCSICLPQGCPWHGRGRRCGDTNARAWSTNPPPPCPNMTRN